MQLTFRCSALFLSTFTLCLTAKWHKTSELFLACCSGPLKSFLHQSSQSETYIQCPSLLLCSSWYLLLAYWDTFTSIITTYTCHPVYRADPWFCVISFSRLFLKILSHFFLYFFECVCDKRNLFFLFNCESFREHYRKFTHLYVWALEFIIAFWLTQLSVQRIKHHWDRKSVV